MHVIRSEYNVNWEEFRVAVYVNGRLSEKKTYYTTCNDDMQDTMNAMIANMTKKGVEYKVLKFRRIADEWPTNIRA